MKTLSRIAWAKLTSDQKYERTLSLDVLRMMRSGKTLTASSNYVGLSKYMIQKNLGHTLIKFGGRWRPTKTDSIQRSMRIYTNGRIKTITINKSRYAKIIGDYYNAVKNFLNSGDADYLKSFKNKKVADIYGRKYRLETDPEKIREIEEAKENPEFYEVYSDE